MYNIIYHLHLECASVCEYSPGVRACVHECTCVWRQRYKDRVRNNMEKRSRAAAVWVVVPDPKKKIKNNNNNDDGKKCSINVGGKSADVDRKSIKMPKHWKPAAELRVWRNRL